MDKIKTPEANVFTNQGKPISQEEVQKVLAKHLALVRSGKTQKDSIEILSKELGRGIWSIKRILDRNPENGLQETVSNSSQMLLFS